MTKPVSTIEDAFRLADEGKNFSEIARELGVARSTLRAWFAYPLEAFYKDPTPIRSYGNRSPRPRVEHAPDEVCPYVAEVPRAEYAYLLGQYLGDGCLSRMAKDVYRLRVATCDDYPDIRRRTADAIAAVMPNRKVGFFQAVGCGEVSGYSKHWPCLFPQHGPGRKHERLIALEPWQQAIVNEHPHELLAGLIHSDGCRCINNVVVHNKPYAYPRYFFSNVSSDILGIFCDTLDLLGVEWKQNRWNSISIAKKESVAYLDTFIGPKT